MVQVDHVKCNGWLISDWHNCGEQRWRYRETCKHKKMDSQRRWIQTEYKTEKLKQMSRDRQIIRRRCSLLRKILLSIKTGLLRLVPANNTQHKTAGEQSLWSTSSQRHPSAILMEKLCAWWGRHGTAQSAMFYTQDCSHSSGCTLLYAVKRTRPLLIISDIFLRTRKCKFKPALLFLHVQAYGCRCFHFKMQIPETWFILQLPM